MMENDRDERSRQAAAGSAAGKAAGNVPAGESYATIRHYTTEAGYKAIIQSGEVRIGNGNAAYGDGVYGAGGNFAKGVHTPDSVLRNNFQHPEASVYKGRGDYFIDLHASPSQIEVGLEPSCAGGRDVQFIRASQVPDGKIKLTTANGHGRVHPDGRVSHANQGKDVRPKNSTAPAAPDAVSEVGSGVAYGGVSGAAISALYAGTDLARGEITKEEAATKVGQGALAGAALGGAYAAAQRVVGGVAPVAVAGLSAANAGKNIKTAIDSGKEKDAKEAVASFDEAVGLAGAAVIAVAAPVTATAAVCGAVCVGVGLAGGYVTRKLL